MRKSLALLSLMAIFTPVLAAPAAADPTPSRRLAAMTPEQFGARMVVKDDPLEFHTIISTERGYRPFGAHPSKTDGDSHLTAMIHRQTGTVTYEVSHRVRHFGPRREFTTVHYPTERGLSSGTPTRSLDSGDFCPVSESNIECIYAKTVAFPVDESVLRKMATRSQIAAAGAWSFKLKETGGQDVTGLITPAEAEALLREVAFHRVKVQAAESAPLPKGKIS